MAAEEKAAKEREAAKQREAAAKQAANVQVSRNYFRYSERITGRYPLFWVN